MRSGRNYGYPKRGCGHQGGLDRGTKHTGAKLEGAEPKDVRFGATGHIYFSPPPTHPERPSDTAAMEKDPGCCQDVAKTAAGEMLGPEAQVRQGGEAGW